MEDDDSGSYFLPHAFPPDMWCLVSDRGTMWSTHSPAHNPQTERDAATLIFLNFFLKRLSCVKNVTFSLSQASSSSTLACTASPLFKGFSLRAPHGKFCWKLIHWAVAKLTWGTGCCQCRFTCWSLLEPRMSQSIILCQDVCDNAWLHVECVCTWENLWPTCRKMYITAAGYDIYTYIYVHSIYKVHAHVLMDACGTV